MKNWSDTGLLSNAVDRICDYLEPEDISQCRMVCRSWSLAFPYILTNAKFDREDIFQDFIDVIRHNPEVGDTFESIDLVYDFDLNMIAETARLAVPDPTMDESWKLKLIDALENVKRLPSLDAEQVKVLNNLVEDKMDIDTIECNKNRVVPSIFLATPKKAKHGKKAVMIFNNHKKKRRLIALDDFALLHAALPKLKSIKSQYLNLKTDGQDEAYAVVDDNIVESVDITLGNTVNSAARLLLFLLESYHKHLKSLKLAMMEDKCKWEHGDNDDNGRAMGEAFKKRSYQLAHLESLEINFFRYSLHIDTFLSALAATMCKLKHAYFLGQVDAKSVFFHMTTYYSDTLESLTISIKEYEDISSLSQLKKLKNFSLIWDTIDEKVDILRALMIMPQLTSLELGYDKRMGELVSNVVGYDQYKFLNHLSLSHVHIEGDEFLKLHDQLPNLKDVTLSGCKIGASRTDKQATIIFGSYNLNALVIEDCRLFYAKRDKKQKKRAITRFMVDLMYDDPYRAKYFSSVKAKEDGKLYVEGDSFVYDFKSAGELDSSDANSLKIEVNSLNTITSTKDTKEWVVFYPETEKDKYEPADDSDETEVEDEEMVSAEEEDTVLVEEGMVSAEEDLVSVEEDEPSAEEKSMEEDAVPFEEEMLSAEEDLSSPGEDIVEELVCDTKLQIIEVQLSNDSEDEVEEVHVGREEAVMEEIAEEAAVEDEYEPVLNNDDEDVPMFDAEVVEEEQIETEATAEVIYEEENKYASDDEVIEEEVAENDLEEQKKAESEVEEQERAESEVKEQEKAESEVEEPVESESETEKVVEEQEDIDSEKPGSDVDVQERQQEEQFESATEDYYDEQYYNDTDEDMVDAEPKKNTQTKATIYCDISDYDDDQPVTVIKATPISSQKKKTIVIESDDDYDNDDFFSTNDNSDSEYDDNMGTVRRYERKLNKAPKRKLRKTPVKHYAPKPRTLFSSSEEDDISGIEDELEYDRYCDLIEGFMKNCKKYKAVIRITDNKNSTSDQPSRKKARYVSPTL